MADRVHAGWTSDGDNPSGKDKVVAVDWKAPLLRWTVLGLMIRIPLCCVVVVVGFEGMTGVIPAPTLRNMLVLTYAFGLVLGLIEGLGKRSAIQAVMTSPIEPTAVPAWGHALSGYRPRTATVLGISAVGFYLAVTGRWGFVVFFAAVQLGSITGSIPPWYFGVRRWQDQTGRRLLLARGGTKLGYASAMPADQVEKVVGGDLGGWGRQWLLNLFASLHHGGRYGDAAALGDHLYRRWRDPSDAYNVACSLTRVGDHDLAVEYLGQALRGGFGRKEMVTDPDLAPLLPRPDVIELFKSTKPPT